MRWPVRPGLQPDEMLSCWIVRLARANGLSTKTFWRIVAGTQPRLFRNVDYDENHVLLVNLSHGTGTAVGEIENALLRDSLGSSMSATSRKVGLRFCPACLAEGATPYFRRPWQNPLYLLCSEHQVWLAEGYPSCSGPIRSEDVPLNLDNIATCSNCANSLSASAFSMTAASSQRAVFLALQHRVLATNENRASYSRFSFADNRGR